jgi:hypothetical protein
MPSTTSKTDPTQVVGVLRSHLEEMYHALDRSAGYFSAMDLADAYRSGAHAPKVSRNTTIITKARDHVEGYLNKEEPDE